jgi:hypothetical protein
MFEIVLGRGNGHNSNRMEKNSGEKYSQLTPHAWLSENRDVCFKIDQ